MVLVDLDPLSLSSSSQYTLTSLLLAAAADAAFPCGQRLHCNSHLWLISGCSATCACLSTTPVVWWRRACYARTGGSQLDQLDQHMQGSAWKSGDILGSEHAAAQDTAKVSLLLEVNAPPAVVPFTMEGKTWAGRRWALHTQPNARRRPAWQGRPTLMRSGREKLPCSADNLLLLAPRF